MSGTTSNKRQPAVRGPRPTATNRSIRSFSLLALLLVNLIVAISMVASCVDFLIAPNQAVKAGPMYVTLALTTGASLLMFFLALNASFLPFVSRQHARDARLVMWAMAGTGIVTGMLTLGGAVQSIAVRLFLGGLAFIFIWVQEARLDRARRGVAPGQAGTPAQQAQPSPKSRQRRGGRRR